MQGVKNGKHFLAAGFVALVLLTLLLVGMPSREGKMIAAYLWPAAVALFVLTTLCQLERPSAAGIAGVLLACWFVVCTLVNGDHYLEFNLRFVYGVVVTFGIGLPLFQTLEGKNRERWLLVAMTVFGVLAAFVALLSTYACLRDRLLALPGMEGTIGITMYRLYAFGRHPNEVGCMLNIGLLCWLMLMFRVRSGWLKALCIAVLAPICFALSLTVSRTAIAIASLVLGGGCLVAVTQKKGWKRWLIGSLLMILVGAVSLYGMMTLIPQLLPSGATDTFVYQEDIEAGKYSQEELEAIQADNEERDGHIWQRGLTDGLGTFSMRTEIWQSGIEHIRQNPRTLLWGNTDGQVARIPYRALDREIYHMHNTYLEILLLSGVPGLVMYAFILICFLWQAARMFFNTETAAWQRVLAAAPVALLPCTLMEIYPSISGRASDMMMLALIGAVIGYGRSMGKGTPSQETLNGRQQTGC